MPTVCAARCESLGRENLRTRVESGRTADAFVTSNHDDAMSVFSRPLSNRLFLDVETETVLRLPIRGDARVRRELHVNPSVAPSDRARFDLRCQSRANG